MTRININNIFETKKRVLLLLISTMISALALVLVYELIETVRYNRWKSQLDKEKSSNQVTIASPNKVLIWEYRPYGNNNAMRMNKYGFKDIDYDSKSKPQDIYRIGFIGDSITMGMGVLMPRIFIKKFERYSNKQNPAKEVQALNFGIDGYNTLQISEMLSTKVLEFQPDKIVYILAMNDFDFEGSSGNKIRYFRKPKSFFIQMVKKILKKLSRKEWHMYYFDINKNTVFEEILKMKNLLEKRSIDFQVVIMPIFPDDTGFDKYPLSYMHNEIKHFLKTHGVSTYDLLDDFRVEEKQPGYYSNGIWHLNETGHDFVGHILTRVLAAKFTLP